MNYKGLFYDNAKKRTTPIAEIFELGNVTVFKMGGNVVDILIGKAPIEAHIDIDEARSIDDLEYRLTNDNWMYICKAGGLKV